MAYLASQLLEIEDVLRTSNLTGDAARMHLNSCFDFPPELENFSAPSSRRKHFMNIAEKAHQTLQTNRQAIQEAREKYMSRANKEDQMETKQKVGDNGKWRNKGITIWVEALYSLLVQGPRKKLADTMNVLNIQEKCIILVYDECGELEQQSREEDLRRAISRMRVVSLLRAFKAADEFEDADGLKIFALLLDTSSSIFKLAPQGKTAPSARLRHPFVHLPPWNFFSFDVNATSKYDTLMQLDHVRLYGRAVSVPSNFLFVTQIMTLLAALGYHTGGRCSVHSNEKTLLWLPLRSCKQESCASCVLSSHTAGLTHQPSNYFCRSDRFCEEAYAVDPIHRGRPCCHCSAFGTYPILGSGDSINFVKDRV